MEANGQGESAPQYLLLVGNPSSLTQFHLDLYISNVDASVFFLSHIYPHNYIIHTIRYQYFNIIFVDIINKIMLDSLTSSLPPSVNFLFVVWEFNPFPLVIMSDFFGLIPDLLWMFLGLIVQFSALLGLPAEFYIRASFIFCPRSALIGSSLVSVLIHMINLDSL